MFELCTDNQCEIIDLYTNEETAKKLLESLGYIYNSDEGLWVSKSGKCKVKVK